VAKRKPVAASQQRPVLFQILFVASLLQLYQLKKIQDLGIYLYSASSLHVFSLKWQSTFSNWLDRRGIANAHGWKMRIWKAEERILGNSKRPMQCGEQHAENGAAEVAEN
jgi:hypothetical protein